MMMKCQKFGPVGNCIVIEGDGYSSKIYVEFLIQQDAQKCHKAMSKNDKIVCKFFDSELFK